MIALFSLPGTSVLHWSEADASRTFGTCQRLAYLTPFFGGLFADRIYGYRRAVITGALLLAAGICCLRSATWSRSMSGSGYWCSETGCSSRTSRRWSATSTIRGLAPRLGVQHFYMGINIGAGLAPLVGGFCGRWLRLGPAFAAAGVGMLLDRDLHRCFRRHLTIADQRSSVSALLDVPLGPDYEDRPDRRRSSGADHRAHHHVRHRDAVLAGVQSKRHVAHCSGRATAPTASFAWAGAASDRAGILRRRKLDLHHHAHARGRRVYEPAAAV